MNILLTYKLTNSIEKLVEFVKNIKTTHNLNFYIYDCRLDKSEELSENDSVIDLDFEDSLNTFQKTVDLAEKTDSLYLIEVEESVEFTHERTLDLLFDEDSIKDPNIGAVYSDFYVNHNGLKVPHFHTSLPSKLSAFPLFAIKTEIAKKVEEINPQKLLTLTVTKHVPELLAMVYA